MQNNNPIRLTRRQQQALETKDRIFQAAMEVINEKGFGNTTIEDITSRAGVASGSFYTYFKSKETIVLDTIQRSDAIYEWAYQQTAQETFLPTIMHFIRLSYAEYEKRGKGIIKAIISNYFSFPEYDFYQQNRSLFRCLLRIVEKGIASGEVSSSRTAAECVSQLLSAMAGVEVIWCFDTGRQSLADLMVETIRTMALGMMVQ